MSDTATTSDTITEQRGTMDNFHDDPDITMPGETPSEGEGSGSEEGDEHIDAAFAKDSGEQDPDQPDDNQNKPPAVANDQATAPKKQITFKMGDKDVGLDEESVVEHKVDGKPTKVPLKELLSNYAGKVAWDKRLNDVALQKRQFTEKEQQFNTGLERQRSLVKDLHEKVGQGKTFEAVQSLVKLTGLNLDAREYVKTLRNSLIEQAQQLRQMTPEQRQVFELNEEREYQASLLSEYRQQHEQEQHNRAYQQRVATAVQSAGMTPDEYNEAYNFLRDPSRGLDASKITPEYVIEHSKQVKVYDTARRAIGSVEPDALDERGLVKDQDKWKKFAQVVTAFPDLSAEELAEIYSAQRKQARSESASRKVLKSPVATAAMASTRGTKQPASDDFTKFTEKDFSWSRRR